MKKDNLKWVLLAAWNQDVTGDAMLKSWRKLKQFAYLRQVRHYSLSFKALLLLLLLILTFVTLRILCHQSYSGHAPSPSARSYLKSPSVTAYSSETTYSMSKETTAKSIAGRVKGCRCNLSAFLLFYS